MTTSLRLLGLAAALGLGVLALPAPAADDKVGPDEPPATGGLANMGGIAFGTWSQRYLDWFRDLGFLNKPGVQTQAAKDVAAQMNRTPRRMGPPPPPAAAAPATAPAK